MFYGFRRPKQSEKSIQTAFSEEGFSLRRVSLVFVVFVLLCTITYGSTSHPIVKGTFIQEWLTVHWTDEMWDSELEYLKEVGIEFLIVAPTGFGIGDGNLRTIYPSKKPNWTDYYPGVDLLGNTLRAAERHGMQVVIGLNMDDRWWQIGVKDPQWLEGQVELGNQLAEEIYNLYYADHRDTICGWYFVFEIDNLMVQQKNAVEVLAKAFNTHLDFLTELDPGLFFMWSPYMNSALATAESYGRFWTELFREVRFREGDIFAPMDCVGGGGTTLENVARWFAEFRKAVDTKPGLLLYSNAENFDHTDWTSATVGRFISQLQLVDEYVDGFINFAYPHYYSPNIIDHGFHKTYLTYVQTGEVESQPPTPPRSIQAVEMPDGSVFLIWEGGEDDVGIAGYLVYRDGRFVGKTQTPRKNAEGYLNAFAEKNLREGRTYTYVLYAYDFAGNLSEPSEEFVFTR